MLPVPRCCWSVGLVWCPARLTATDSPVSRQPSIDIGLSQSQIEVKIVTLGYSQQTDPTNNLLLQNSTLCLSGLLF